MRNPSPAAILTCLLFSENAGFLKWPGKALVLDAPAPNEETKVRMLGVGQVRWKPSRQGLTVEVPPLSAAELPCRHAWVFEIAGLRNIR